MQPETQHLGCISRTPETSAPDQTNDKKRKARDSNPHHLSVSRISNAARQTVSGYLPCFHCRLSVEHRGIEPRSSVCKTDVFPLDEHPISIFLQHAPKDSNPDSLVWNQQCYRYTKGVHSSIFRFRLFGPNFILNAKLQWERKELHLSPTTTQLMAGGLQPVSYTHLTLPTILLV